MEAGFAAASEGDFQSVKRIANTIQNATVMSLARAKESDIRRAYDAVKGAVSPRLHVFLATSDIHMKYKLCMSKEDVLISSSLGYAREITISNSSIFSRRCNKNIESIFS